MKNVFANFLRKLNTANIRTLVAWPIAIGLVFFIGSLVISERIYSKGVPDAYIAVVGIISALIFSLSGLIQIYRREGPGVLGETVKGIWPVLMGIIWVTFTWILGFMLLYQLLVEVMSD